MDDPDVKEGARFLESILNQDDLGAIVRAHLFIESLLLRLINEGLVDLAAVNLTRLDFPTKLGLAIAVGSVPDSLKTAFLQLNRLRNKLAHDVRANITEVEASALFASLPKSESEFLYGKRPDSPDTSLRSSLSFLYGRLDGIARRLREAKQKST